MHDPEMIETCLWEVVLTGGNVSEAHRKLKMEWQAADRDVDELPAPETIRKWVRGAHRNRYHEIQVSRARDLEEIVAHRHMERVIRLDLLEQDAERVIAGRINDLDAVDAANVLRSLAQAKRMSAQTAQELRRGASQAEDSRSLAMIAGQLERLGVGRVIDATAEEIPAGEGETPSLPAETG